MADTKQLSNEERFPELYHTTYEDPRRRTRTKPMEILVIGMMRTGTMSLKSALAELGYKDSYHMTNIIANPPDADMWRDAAQAKWHNKGKPFTRKEWDQLLGHSQVCLDVPSALFMPELIAAYPDAKVIVSERDASKWYKSCQDTIMKRGSFLFLPIVLLDGAYFRRFIRMISTVTSGAFGPKGMEDPENAKMVFHELHEEVRRVVPEERMLEFQLGDGWEPLCEFLGKDVPNKPFPHVNDTKLFVERMGLVQSLAVQRVMKNTLPWLVAATAIGAGMWFGYGPSLRR